MDKLEVARKMFNSSRGQYIISQALCLAIKAINARPKVEQEPSNMADMELLVEELFPIYRHVKMAQSLMRGRKP